MTPPKTFAEELRRQDSLTLCRAYFQLRDHWKRPFGTWVGITADAIWHELEGRYQPFAESR